MNTLRVAVAGGGLGGLCLAQGLLQAGADVTVYERNASLAGRRQGYRLHVDARAGLALQACLPPESLALFQATCGQASRRLTVVSEKLRVLHEQVSANPAADPYAPATLSTSVNRLTFREVLAAGLDGRIAFGHELSGYETEAGGVRLHFADGQSADADVLVGADGVNSAVRRQYLPAAEPADSGGWCIYGKTPLRGQAALPMDGFTAVVGGRIGMALGAVRFREPPQAFGLTPAQDYVMWALAGDRRAFGVPDEQLTALDPAGLHALSAELIRTWHPDLRALHAEADIGQTFGVRVRTSPPVPAWPPSRVHEPRPRFGRQHRPARRRAAQRVAGYGRRRRRRRGGGDRRLRTADARVRLRRRRRLEPGRGRNRCPPQPDAVLALPPPAPRDPPSRPVRAPTGSPRYGPVPTGRWPSAPVPPAATAPARIKAAASQRKSRTDVPSLSLWQQRWNIGVVTSRLRTLRAGLRRLAGRMGPAGSSRSD